MQMITTIGLDIAKSVFQVHGVDAAGEVEIRRPRDRPKPSYSLRHRRGSRWVRLGRRSPRQRALLGDFEYFATNKSQLLPPIVYPDSFSKLGRKEVVNRFSICMIAAMTASS
jgi:hypothetical protein